MVIEQIEARLAGVRPMIGMRGKGGLSDADVVGHTMLAVVYGTAADEERQDHSDADQDRSNALAHQERA